MRETTLHCQLRHLRAALGWAVSQKMLAEVPEIKMPKRAKGRQMRGRPITEEEFDRMVAAVPKVREKGYGHWQRYLRGLWLSGLRLAESVKLSWDYEAPFAIDLSGRHPRFRIYAEGQKSNRDQLLPMAPDFAEWILQVPDDERTGRVFKLEDVNTGRALCSNRVGRIAAEIGRAAGVIVNKAEGEYASAHDLRRSFANRWAPKVKPVTLQVLMRHESLATTMAYYVCQDADDVADELWAVHAGNTSGNTRPESCEKQGSFRAK